jgi:hypothetical protein
MRDLGGTPEELLTPLTRVVHAALARAPGDHGGRFAGADLGVAAGSGAAQGGVGALSASASNASTQRAA